MYPTIEEFIAKWSEQTGLKPRPEELAFIEAMRLARGREVGYGWMMQMIEVEWDAVTQGQFTRRQEAERELEIVRRATKKFKEISDRHPITFTKPPKTV